MADDNSKLAWDGIRAEATKTFGAASALLAQWGVPFGARQIIAGFLGGVVLLGMSLLAAFMAALRYLAVPLAVSIMETITTVRQEGAEDFAKATGAAMGEFLGFDVDVNEIAKGVGADANLARARQFGDKLHTLLEHEFTGGGAVTPQSGATGARAFSGYVMNFAATNSFISILTEMLSLGEFEQWRELGVEIAQNLGLGRLHRQALQPLVRNTIAQPYDKFLRKKYRQDDLSEAQLVKALHTGALTESEVRDSLAEKGYPDKQITELIRQLTLHLTDAEVERLLRFGVIDESAALAQLIAEGWPRESAILKLRSIVLSRLWSLEQQFLNTLEKQYISGWIDLGAFNKGLESTHLTFDEKQLELKYVGQVLDAPQVDLTWGEVKAALVDGIVDLDYLDSWLVRAGYSREDRQNLTLIALQAVADADAKQAAAAVKAGQDHHKKLTVAELRKLYTAGTMSFAQVQAYLLRIGYSVTDAAMLLTTFAQGKGNIAEVQQAINLAADSRAADVAADAAQGNA
jgi:SOS response regulatory protein OraA/RecX